MFDLNDDNNDELFRKAAEYYPLRTDGSEWQKVQDKMNAAEDVPPAETIVRKRNYWPLLLLLLLIPLKMYENKVIPVGNGKNTPASEQPGAINKKQSATAQKITQPNNDTIVNNSSTISDNGTADNNNNGIPTNNIVSSFKSISRAVAENTRSSLTNKSSSIQAVDHKHSIISSGKTKVLIQNVSPENDLGAEAEAIHGNDQVKTIRSDSREADIPADKTTGKKVKPLIENSPKVKTSDEKVKVIAKTSIDKKNKPRKNHFYIGLIVAPDLSTIKLQSVKKTGLNYGIMAGYRINKRFSIETGLLKDKKNYSTEGKYFNTKEVYLPAGATILYVDGQCNMLELPVNITYGFRLRERSAMFLSPGVSSYFMRSERYVYDIKHNGYTYPRSADYHEKSTSLAAVINLSAGYTYKLGKILDLRVEPYVKLPLNKIGTGNLPIESAGVIVGISKALF